jgi:hypothetical protein
VLAISVVPIVIIVVVAVLVLLALGGWIASGRRRQGDAARLRAQVRAADAALAAARAEDRGWERATIEAAARMAFQATHGDADITELHLVQVRDRPGTDADEAVFRVRTADGADRTITLGRRQGAWVPADVR